MGRAVLLAFFIQADEVPVLALDTFVQVGLVDPAKTQLSFDALVFKGGPVIPITTGCALQLQGVFAGNVVGTALEDLLEALESVRSERVSGLRVVTSHALVLRDLVLLTEVHEVGSLCAGVGVDLKEVVSEAQLANGLGLGPVVDFAVGYLDDGSALLGSFPEVPWGADGTLEKVSVGHAKGDGLLGLGDALAFFLVESRLTGLTLVEGFKDRAI